MAAITTRVQTASVAGAGTITCSTSSPTVTGSGTAFLTAVIIGQQLTNSGGTYIGTVLTVDSNTQITLVSNAAVDVSAGAYNIVSTGITTKGSPLTNSEIDANFVNLNNAVVAGANSSVTNVANTLVKRGPSGEFSAGVATLAAGTNVGGTSVPTSNASQAQMEAGSDTSTRFMSANNIKQAIDVLALQSIGNLTKDMTGFESLAGSNFSYVAGTRVFTLAPSGAVPAPRTFNVTASGGKFYIDGVMQATVELTEGGTYTFDQSDASNSGHPLRFSTTSNGTHSGGVEYTTNVTTNGTPGTSGAYTRITVATGAPTLYYYCVNHSGMGGTATTPPSGYSVWYRGKKTVITSSLNITLSASGGTHWIGINPTTLALEEFTNDSTIFTDTILVAVVYLNSTYDAAVIIGDERHSAARDTQFHAAQHNSVGAIWKSGGQMTYTLNNDSATTISLSSPIYLIDEDMTHAISHAVTPNGYFQQVLNGAASLPTIYLSGNHYTQTAESTVPWIVGVTSTARYNPVVGSNGSLADVPNNNYLNYWIILTNDTVRPVKAVMGKAYYSNVNDAYAEQFSVGSLPFAEAALMYRVTLLTNTAYAGNKVRLISVKTMTDQQSSSLKTYETISHALLANTTSSDDHTQYVHISNARTISAGHTFNGNNTFGGTNNFQSIVYFNGSVASNLLPNANASYDLGSISLAWRNVYTNDLHLSNEGHEEGNSVDGTKGNWTIQEGDSNLFIINNKNGKKYKFSLEEIK